MNVYVASSWRNSHQPRVVELLKQLGHDVYDFKHPAPGDNGFHWSEIDKDWKGWDGPSFRAGLKHDIALRGFAKDMGALRRCDCLVLVLPSGRSAHLEAGWASGALRHVIVYIPAGEQIEPELMYSMTDNLVTTEAELLALFKPIQWKPIPRRDFMGGSLPAEVAKDPMPGRGWDGATYTSLLPGGGGSSSISVLTPDPDQKTLTEPIE